MNNYIITQADLDENPLLLELGYKVGDSLHIKDGGAVANGGPDKDPLPPDPAHPNP